MGLQPGQPYRAPELRSVPHLVNAAVVVLKFLIIFEQGYLHFHFAWRPTNYVAGSAPQPMGGW